MSGWVMHFVHRKNPENQAIIYNDAGDGEPALFGNREAHSTPVPKNNFSLDDSFCRGTAHGWLWNMRVLLHNVQTGSYFQTVANWTDDAHVAFDFEQVERAQMTALETGLAQAEVVLWYDSPLCQLRLPIVQPAEISEAVLLK